MIPKELLPTPEERSAIEQHIARLVQSEAAIDPMVAGRSVAGLLVSYPLARNVSDEVQGAKAELYTAAIEDIPGWAVNLGCRAWARGETNVQKRDGIIGWAPSPDQLRAVALDEKFKASKVRISLERLAKAIPFEPRAPKTERLARPAPASPFAELPDSAKS